MLEQEIENEKAEVAACIDGFLKMMFCNIQIESQTWIKKRFISVVVRGGDAAPRSCLPNYYTTTFYISLWIDSRYSYPLNPNPVESWPALTAEPWGEARTPWSCSPRIRTVQFWGRNWFAPLCPAAPKFPHTAVDTSAES